MRTTMFVEHQAVSGASIALVSPEKSGYNVLAIQRDNIPTIPYPNLWEFPGGTIDPGETPLECALRELYEETGVTLAPEAVLWRAFYPSRQRSQQGLLLYSAFFGALVNKADYSELRLGSEGQDCQWISAKAFCGYDPLHPIEAVYDHTARYADFFQALGGAAITNGSLRHIESAPHKKTRFATDPELFPTKELHHQLSHEYGSQPRPTTYL